MLSTDKDIVDILKEAGYKVVEGKEETLKLIEQIHAKSIEQKNG